MTFPYPHILTPRTLEPEYKLLRYHKNNPLRKDIMSCLISIFETPSYNISSDWLNELRKADIYVKIKSSS